MGSVKAVSEPSALEGNLANTETLSADELELRAQGHTGELPRQFNALSTLSLAFTITNSWIAYSAVFMIPLTAGGGPCVIYSLLVGFAACSIIVMGLAELASAFPTSGGQYHFSFMVSSAKYRAAISYTVGWISVLSWWMLAAGSCIFCAQAIGALATIYHPDYVATQWQIYLIYVALTIIAIALIVLFPEQLPRAEIGCFVMSVLGFIASTIVVLVRSDPKQTTHTVFVEWNNQSGWNNGVAFMIGVGQGMFSFAALDAATHLCEELPQPRKNIPRVMGLTMITGMVTVLIWSIAFMYSITDLDEVMTSPAPYMTVYIQAIRNTKVSIFFTVWLLAAYYSATISCCATSGRLVWAFSRDNGLPYSDFFRKVHPTLRTPVNATLLTATFVIIYGLIYIGSTTAFSSFLSVANLGLNATYVIPQIIAAIRGRDKVLPPRPFALGHYTGYFCNIFATIWIAMYTVWYCFPTFIPVEPNSMNYLSVIAVGSLLFIVLSWFLAKKKTFTGPNVVLDDDDRSNSVSATTNRVSVEESAFGKGA